jgi:hypothetical protein
MINIYDEDKVSPSITINRINYNELIEHMREEELIKERERLFMKKWNILFPEGDNND